MQHCGAGLRRVGGPTDYGGRITGEGDVDEGRETGRSRPFKGGGQVAGRVDVFAMTAQRFNNTVVPRR